MGPFGHDDVMDQEDALILLEKVSKSYGEGENVAPTHVLSEVDLKVSSGQTLAIVGPSGSGKSSLLNILGALDQATSGKVMVAGRDLNACNEAELAAFRRTTIGFVFQSHHLLPQLSVVENVLVPLLAEPSLVTDGSLENRAEQLLDRVGLSHRLDHRPGQLSGGERQRVAVVRALIRQPQLLLADEPTGALDHQASENLGGLLLELNREENMTRVMVTHSRELAERTDKMWVLKGGQLCAP